MLASSRSPRRPALLRGLTMAPLLALLPTPATLPTQAGSVPAQSSPAGGPALPAPESGGEALRLAIELGLDPRLASELAPGLDLSDPRFLALLQAPNLPVLARPEALELFELRSGDLLVGALLEHDEQRLVLARADNGGRVELPWSAFEPACAEALAKRLGYAEEAVEEYTLSADRIPLAEGGELIGVLDARSTDPLRVKRASGIILLPRSRVGGAITAARVPARELYTRAELYELRRSELASALLPEAEPAVLAAAELELTRFCEQIRDYAHAFEGYGRLLALAGSQPAALETLEAAGLDRTQLDVALERARVRAEAQGQADRLDELERSAQRGDFVTALDGLADFAKTYPKSPLLEDASLLGKRILKDRDQAVSRLVADRWYYWAARLSREYAREEDFTKLREALDEEFPQKVVAAVTSDARKLQPDLEDSAVRAAFDKRRPHSVRTVSYGDGTWLLGAEAAKAGKVEQEQPEDEENQREQERADLLERIERYQRNQQSQTQGRDDEEGPDPAEFWKTWTLANRSQWIQAYYAEFGKVFELRSVTLMAHADCAGTGFIEVLQIGAGGSRRLLLKDPGCNGVGVRRRISFR
jgi:hypothetical protein